MISAALKLVAAGASGAELVGREASASSGVPTPAERGGPTFEETKFEESASGAFGSDRGFRPKPWTILLSIQNSGL